jgi:hypothetical protein
MNHVEKAYLWGLCLALAENTACPSGRLISLLKRLQKEVVKRLKRPPKLTPLEINECKKKYIEFDSKVQWNRRRITALTWANFLLTILGEAPKEFDKTIEIIQGVVEYFDRAGNARPAQYWAAERFLG